LGSSGAELSNELAQIILASTIDMLFKDLFGVAKSVAFSYQNWAFATNELTNKMESKIFFIIFRFKICYTKIKKNTSN
jgi:hypothetical protein